MLEDMAYQNMCQFPNIIGLCDDLVFFQFLQVIHISPSPSFTISIIQISLCVTSDGVWFLLIHSGWGWDSTAR